MVLLCNGNELSWVRSYLGTNQFGYEPVCVLGIIVLPPIAKFANYFVNVKHWRDTYKELGNTSLFSHRRLDLCALPSQIKDSAILISLPTSGRV